ncbi:MAG: type II toxin-antitoxin system HicA family toxin [Pleurocapsa sp.]
MPKLPAVTADEAIKALEKNGFQVVRQKGSHVRLRNQNNLVATVPIHKGKTLGKSPTKKNIRDADLTVGEFTKLL